MNFCIDPSSPDSISFRKHSVLTSQPVWSAIQGYLLCFLFSPSSQCEILESHAHYWIQNPE